MRAHQLGANGEIINTVVVDSLDFLPGLVDAAIGGEIGDSVIDGVLHKKSPPPPTKGEIEAAIQGNLDSYAKSWGYNDIASACTYVGDPCAKFNAEAIALRQWRSDTWAMVEATDAQIASGMQPYPQTIEAALSMLPAAPERPA